MVFERLREVTKMFTDAGLTPVHENCMDFGGMSSAHALEMLDKCPGLKWVFDTANPIFNADRQLTAPWNSAEFRHERAQRTPRSRAGGSSDWDGFYPTGSPARNLALRSLCPFAVIPFRSSGFSGPGRRVCTQRGSKRAGSQAGQAEDGSYSFGFRPTPQMSQTASATRRMSHQK